MSQYRKVCLVTEISNGRTKCIERGGKKIAICNVDGEFYAIDDFCTHAYASLSDGNLCGEEIECPLHGARYNVKTGAATAPPAIQAVATYPVRINGEYVEILI